MKPIEPKYGYRVLSDHSTILIGYSKSGKLQLSPLDLPLAMVKWWPMDRCEQQSTSAYVYLLEQGTGNSVCVDMQTGEAVQDDSSKAALLYQ